LKHYTQKKFDRWSISKWSRWELCPHNTTWMKAYMRIKWMKSDWPDIWKYNNGNKQSQDTLSRKESELWPRRRRKQKQGQIQQWPHGHPHLLLIRSFAREEGKRKDEYCNDRTVTHTCCSLVDLSEKRHVCHRSVFMNTCAMSVRYAVFGNWQKYECLMSVTTTFDMFYICSRVRYANFDLKRTM